MSYNLTYTGSGVIGIFQFMNSIFPLSSAILLLFLPFVILLISFIRYGAPVAFTVSSFLSVVWAILLTSAGLIDSSFMVMFMAFTVIGFAWMSAKR